MLEQDEAIPHISVRSIAGHSSRNNAGPFFFSCPSAIQERILIDIRAEKYAYEKGKSHEKIEDQAQEDRLTKNGLQIRELAVSNCAPKDLSSPARLSDGGSGRHRSCSGGGDASGSSSGHSPLLNADGGSVKRRPGTTSRSSSRRGSPPPRLGIGAELMSQLTEECGIDDLLFKRRTGASFLQYMLLIEGGWSDTQISEAMEEKLFAVLVDGVTEVMPGGEASNGYKGNNVAAKRCRSCMTWRGVGAERLGLLCARFGLEAGKVKAAMLEEVPHCTDADVDAWVEEWEGDDLPWAMADKMNASFASHLVAGCRSGGLELMMDGDKNFNNEGDEQYPACTANNREKSKSGREKGEGRYRADDASLHRCADTLSLDSGRGVTGNGRTSSGACSVAARGLSNTDVSFA